jgi:hypothetical protein
MDYSKLQGAATVSLKDDLVPIFEFACVASDCHNDQDQKAGLVLGTNDSTKRGQYDPNAKWQWTLPAPLDPAFVAQIQQSLTSDSKTVPGTKRAAPGDPEHSFILDKISDTENDKGFTNCANQDLTRSTLKCGTYMPPTSDTALCQQDQKKFDAIATWIIQGAQNN